MEKFIALCLLHIASVALCDAGPEVCCRDTFIVLDFVGDPLITSETVSGLVGDLLDNDELLQYGDTWKYREIGGDDGYYRIKNILRKCQNIQHRDNKFNIYFEVEQVYYGPPAINMRNKLLNIWVWGPLLSAFDEKPGDYVTAVVQLRANIYKSNGELVASVVMYGAEGGELHNLSRQVGLNRAIRKCVWDICSAVVDCTSRVINVQNKPSFVACKPDGYRGIVEEWVQSSWEMP